MKKRIFSLGLAGLTLIGSYKSCGSDAPRGRRQPAFHEKPQGTVSGDPSRAPAGSLDISALPSPHGPQSLGL